MVDYYIHVARAKRALIPLYLADFIKMTKAYIAKQLSPRETKGLVGRLVN